jgi:uncharacterized protein
MDEKTRLKSEAVAFRGLLGHLRRCPDAQSVDPMNLAGFRRSCLSKP